MSHLKKNISLPAELYKYVESRVDRINTSGEHEGTSTDFSKQIAVAVSRLMKEDSVDYGDLGKASAPQPSTSAPAQTARTSVRYTAPKPQSKTR